MAYVITFKRIAEDRGMSKNEKYCTCIILKCYLQSRASLETNGDPTAMSSTSGSLLHKQGLHLVDPLKSIENLTVRLSW